MDFADNWARIFVVSIFLGLGGEKVFGGIITNLIAFGLFVVAISYFGLNSKIAEKIGLKKPSK